MTEAIDTHPTLQDITEPPEPPNHELCLFIGEPKYAREYLMPIGSCEVWLPYPDGSKVCYFRRGVGQYKKTFVFMGYEEE